MQSLQCFSEGEWSVRTHVVSDVSWFCAKDVARALGYANSKQAIASHVFEEDRVRLQDLMGLPDRPMLSYHEKASLYITEAGVYALIFGSQKEEAKQFKRWVCSVVLPRLRKQHQEQTKAPLALKGESDLHHLVVKSIRRFWPHSLLVAGLGELQDTPEKRMFAWRSGYGAGQPDVLILNHHKTHNGFAIELKNPKGSGKLTDKQFNSLERYRAAGFKTLVADEFVLIWHELINYFQDIRLSCSHCGRKFKTEETLQRHCALFHKH